LVLPKKEENLLLSILTVETKPILNPTKKDKKGKKNSRRRKERERERILQIHTSMEVWQAAR